MILRQSIGTAYCRKQNGLLHQRKIFHPFLRNLHVPKRVPVSPYQFMKTLQEPTRYAECGTSLCS